ncbi:hypothetical protein FACS189425_09770 [Clostridia bacterium]|nr:hypothetical protein FACS189425_09770 [Clostridia bacterium]
MFKKLFSIAFTLVLAAGLTACGGNKQPEIYSDIPPKTIDVAQLVGTPDSYGTVDIPQVGELVYAIRVDKTGATPYNKLDFYVYDGAKETLRNLGGAAENNNYTIDFLNSKYTIAKDAENEGRTLITVSRNGEQFSDTLAVPLEEFSVISLPNLGNFVLHRAPNADLASLYGFIDKFGAGKTRLYQLYQFHLLTN